MAILLWKQYKKKITDYRNGLRDCSERQVEDKWSLVLRNETKPEFYKFFGCRLVSDRRVAKRIANRLKTVDANQELIEVFDTKINV